MLRDFFGRLFLMAMIGSQVVMLTSAALPADEPAPKSLTNILYRDDNAQLDDYARERCRLDLYVPEGKRDFPTVVWFHGGGLTGGNKSIPARLKGQGVAVVAVNYRLSPKVKVEDCIRDAAAATAWVFRNIEDHGGRPDAIFVSGHSAGGYLTSMLGYDKRWLKEQGIDADEIAGLIPFSGHTITHMTARSELGIGQKQPLVDELAPLYHVRSDAPPTLLISGDRELEMLGRYEENAYFWRMLQVNGHPDAVLLELDGYNHGQMADPAFPLLVRFVQRIERKGLSTQ